MSPISGLPAMALPRKNSNITFTPLLLYPAHPARCLRLCQQQSANIQAKTDFLQLRLMKPQKIFRAKQQRKTLSRRSPGGARADTSQEASGAERPGDAFSRATEGDLHN